MTARRAFFEGLRRMSRAPGMVAMIWAMNLAVAAPLGMILMQSIHDFTKNSDYHQALTEGFDTGWHTEFASAHRGVEGTFGPGQLGVGAWLSNLDRWWDGSVFLANPRLVAAGAIFVLVWLLLLGGVLEALREGAPRPRLTAVLAEGVARFPRLVRLALFSGAAYYLVFRFARWLFPKIHAATIDLTVERTVLAYNLAGAALIVLLVVAVRLVSDYAKVALVIERRSSAAFAFLRGLRFVAGNPVRVFAIALFYGVLLSALFVLYSAVAPGAGESTPVAILAAFALSQLFLGIKFSLRVALLGSEVALFEIAG